MVVGGNSMLIGFLDRLNFEFNHLVSFSFFEFMNCGLNRNFLIKNGLYRPNINKTVKSVINLHINDYTRRFFTNIFKMENEWANKSTIILYSL
jgi:hypothetical protein